MAKLKTSSWTFLLGLYRIMPRKPSIEAHQVPLSWIHHMSLHFPMNISRQGVLLKIQISTDPISTDSAGTGFVFSIPVLAWTLYTALLFGWLMVNWQAKIQWCRVKSVTRAMEKVVRSYSQVLLYLRVSLFLAYHMNRFKLHNSIHANSLHH